MSGGGARERVLVQLGVSRETATRLEDFVTLLGRWQSVQNLVAPSTLPHIWHRHILDSAQLYPLLGAAKTIVDLGSGAGFPGLILALLAPPGQGFLVHLIESNQRKAAFLTEAVRVTRASAIVHARRADKALPDIAGPVDVVTARALAPLDELLAIAEPLLKTGARGLFLKGRDAEQELTQGSKTWRIHADLIPSLSDPAGRIVHVRQAERQGASPGMDGRHD
jgi:16S rRNA (guanine527-N7)-methyltransferase